jgi:GAG-pre-integrase domain
MMVENVHFIFEMKNNILSVRQLMEEFEIFMKNHALHLKDKPEREIARVVMGESIMFKLNLWRIDEKYLKVNKEDEVWIWHMRFGHLRYSDLRDLVKKQSVQGLSNLELENFFYE